MDRIALIRSRCEALNLVAEPTDEQLNTVNDEIVETDILFVQEKVCEDEELSEDEEFEVLTFMLGERAKTPKDMPLISREAVEKKEIDTFIPMTEGLKFQMESVGLNPDDAEGDGELAILLIEEQEKNIALDKKIKESKKEALRNFCRSLMRKDSIFLDMLIGVPQDIKCQFLNEIIQNTY